MFQKSPTKLVARTLRGLGIKVKTMTIHMGQI